MVGDWWVGGGPIAGSGVGGRWSEEDLSVGRWSVSRWSVVGGRWFCNTPNKHEQFS